MRTISIVAGLTVMLAACGGGEKKTQEQPATGGAPSAGAADTSAPTPAAAPAAATGKSHDVNMVLDGSKYKFDPDNLTIQSGDVVRYHNKSGGPHNVSFWPDSVPSGAADLLKKNMPNQMAPLEGPLLTEPDAVYEVSFAGAPKGDYKFYCLPHLALGMHGKVSVK
ncbi:MAG TPA: plastocyanin/azurin family copper-binding protein [Gemmatimonadales bacterium]|jgi:plastocyanin|nr:plastocyanin/azurin family copper-binding protein [Gemmatimonadales bacterium]